MNEEELLEKKGAYIDWSSLRNLPQIDSLIDVGVGPWGTPDLWEAFPEAELLLVDPLFESKRNIEANLTRRFSFFLTAVGSRDASFVELNVENIRGRSSLLNTTEINKGSGLAESRLVPLTTLDKLMSDVKIGAAGLKIDAEGYELEIILGGVKTLKKCKFVIVEARHTHRSFDGIYQLSDLVYEFQVQGFVLSKIFSCKPFIADLCFEPIADLYPNSYK